MLPQDKWFYFANGKNAKDLPELADALKEMSADEFAFHVNSGKNDFANWVEGVFEEKELSAALREAVAPNEMIFLLEAFFKRHRRQEQREQQEVQGVQEELPIQAALEESRAAEPVEEPAEELVEEPVAEPLPEDAPKHVLEPVPEYLPEKEHAQESLEKYTPPSFAATEQPAPVLREEPRAEELRIGGEHELAHLDLKEMVDDAKQELEIEGRQLGSRKESRLLPREDKAGFLVKEFIYGFILGLIFGLIMLGALLNIKV
jgi:hypothetical protein